MKHLLEICCADLESVIVANEAGADRIELCTALSVGGLTPSYGMIAEAVEMSHIPVNVLIRPREGDFVYTKADVRCMLADVEACARAGASGVVIGGLKRDCTIDGATCCELVSRAKESGLTVTFHRAFDLCSNPSEAIEAIIDMGCDRILTSGQQPSASEGADLLRKLVEQADDRIIIMPGAGVNSRVIADLAARTQAKEFHASAKKSVRSLMQSNSNQVSMGSADSEEYIRTTADPAEAFQLSKIIHSL